ncbi:MAG: methyltransferase domain-containing protein [Candidatus Acidiferrum sp.]
MAVSLYDRVVQQCKKPSGLFGRFVGWILATRPSNVRRNAWTVRLLEIQPGQNVLEIGCGPGVGLKDVLGAGATHVLGADHSQTMLDQSAKRNAAALGQGRLELRLGSLESLPPFDHLFDRLFSVNIIQFIADRPAAFRALFAVTAPGGLVATTYQPRGRNPTRVDALRMAEEIARHAQAAGFVDVRTEELPLEPAPAICVLGRRASES